MYVHVLTGLRLTLTRYSIIRLLPISHIAFIR